ncbi:hypothetical protein SKAU_G00183260 [Synaphobranchus kaupii]|uniref:Protein kinase domain-containing protein n=1 Tax=Synaphobranchus kaupii TaxID=118154 RepID=A0A9Q1FC73_SYNKA|nr:hypothetical protein SKAU_G00183260 [Synaphobranchus kaupii]
MAARFDNDPDWSPCSENIVKTPKTKAALAGSLVMLESLEDACVLRGVDDSLSDKHGCPAYVSPEVLSGGGSYSGPRADVWSLGVMLYTMLLPDSLTPKARCLIRSVLRRDPAQRLTAREILEHPWLASSLDAPPQPGPAYGRGDRGSWDQLVPDVNMQEELDKFFS